MPCYSAPTPGSARKFWPHLAGLDFVDPDYADHTKVDYILSADIYSTIILNGLNKGPTVTPVSQQSVFGWLLTDVISLPSEQNFSFAVRAFHLCTEPSLSHALMQFWEIEEIARKWLLPPAEERCVDHFADTRSRDENGRLTVCLPFAKKPTRCLPNSSEVATVTRSSTCRALRELHAIVPGLAAYGVGPLSSTEQTKQLPAPPRDCEP